MNPAISVIVPVFKVEKYLHKCIESILIQTLEDFELILVNDGSPDNCGKICDYYANSDNRVKVLHQSNGGLSAARNTGISVAKGKYISFVDGDDYIHNRMLEVLYSTIECYSSDMAVCDFSQVNESNPVESRKPGPDLRIQHYTNLEALSQLYASEEIDEIITGAGNNVKWIVVWNKLYNRKLFSGINFAVGRICEDEFIMHKLLYQCKKVSYVPASLYFYLQRSESIIGSNFTLKRFDKVHALRERTEFFKRLNKSRLYNKALKSYLEAFFWNYYTAKSFQWNNSTELRSLKKTFNKYLLPILKNPFIGWKQKIAVLIFVINPSIYEMYIRKDASTHATMDN